MPAIPEKIRSTCIAALKVGFTPDEVKSFIQANWPEADALVTCATLNVWQRELRRG